MPQKKLAARNYSITVRLNQLEQEKLERFAELKQISASEAFRLLLEQLDLSQVG